MCNYALYHYDFNIHHYYFAIHVIESSLELLVANFLSDYAKTSFID